MKLHVEGFGCQMDGYDWFVSTPVRNLKREATEDMKALRQIIAEHKKLQAENARLREELASAEKVREGLIKCYTGMAEDAKRYRWLKENCVLGIKQNGNGWSLNTRQCVAPDCTKELDAAIDDAIEKEQS